MSGHEESCFLDIDGVLNTKWWYTQMGRNTLKRM